MRRKRGDNNALDSDIYKIEEEAWSEWGTTRTITYLDHTWKDEADRMVDRMERNI